MNDNALNKDLYVLDNDKNAGSKMNKIWASTVLDQVFDNMDPEKKNLRQILSDLRQEILTGGKGVIIFPVTSVNGQTGEVVLTKDDLGLSNVDNTSDTNKPLSILQRDSVLELIQQNKDELNLDQVYNHLRDFNNPHQVTLAQVNTNNQIEKMISDMIVLHNNSINTSTHGDIRDKISTLWNKFDDLNNGLDKRLDRIMRHWQFHYTDPEAHNELFVLKEDISNKTIIIDEDDVNNHIIYPSNKAMIDYINLRERDLIDNKLLPIKNWISDIIIIDNRSELPMPVANLWNVLYVIRNGETSHDELAICRKNNNEYEWDINPLGSYTKFDDRYIYDTTNGLSLRMNNIVEDFLTAADINRIISNHLNQLLFRAIEGYINRNELIKKIKIVPGTDNGTIQFYINDDPSTISEEVKVRGLQRLAYLEWITENELNDKAVGENHIMDHAIVSRHLKSNLMIPGTPTIENSPSNTSNSTEIASTEWVRNYMSKFEGFDDLSSKLTDIENIKQSLSDKANRSELEDLKQTIPTNLNNVLKNKTDRNYVDTELNKKADKAVVNLKADSVYVNERLLNKADINYVNNKLDTKVNISDLDNKLMNKANRVDLDNLRGEINTNIQPKLDEKANITYVNEQLATKLSRADINQLLGNIPDISELAEKANKTDVYTKEEVNQRIQRVIGSAPEALNTLKELSDALGNDHNFASTITTKLNEKVDRNSLNALLQNKADKSYVTEQINLNGVTRQYVEGKLDEKADLSLMNQKLNEKVSTNDLSTKLSSKADRIDLESKADKETTLNALNSKVDKNELAEKLLPKADKSFVTQTIDARLNNIANNAQLEEKLRTKANVSDVNNLRDQLLLKVNTSDLNSKLDLKENKADITNKLRTKADVSYVDNKITSGVLWNNIQQKPSIFSTMKMKTITIEGDHDKYYPIVIQDMTGSPLPYLNKLYIARGFSARAPREWNNSTTHMGSLQLMIEFYANGWGGQETWYDVKWKERYSSIFGGFKFVTTKNQLVIYLRGGTADYRLYADAENFNVTIFLEGYRVTHQAPYEQYNQTFSPLTKPMNDVVQFPNGGHISNINMNNHIRSLDLTYQVQNTSNRKSVIALCDLDNQDNEAYSYSQGEIFFKRHNGFNPPISIRFNVQKEYNSNNMHYSIFTLGDRNNAVKACTFTYNGKKYGGLEFFFNEGNYQTILFSGISNFRIFGLDYYDTRNKTAINAEVNGSINFTHSVKGTKGNELNRIQWNDILDKPDLFPNLNTNYMDLTYPHDKFIPIEFTFYDEPSLSAEYIISLTRRFHEGDDYNLGMLINGVCNILIKWKSKDLYEISWDQDNITVFGGYEVSENSIILYLHNQTRFVCLHSKEVRIQIQETPLLSEPKQEFRNKLRKGFVTNKFSTDNITQTDNNQFVTKAEKEKWNSAKGNSIIKTFDLSSQIQLSGDRKSVIVLAEEVENSQSQGEIYFRNTLEANDSGFGQVIKVNIHYSNGDFRINLFEYSSEPITVENCSFTYNGKRYAGLIIESNDDAYPDNIYFVGITNFEIFGLDYIENKSANNPTVLNSEINSSIREGALTEENTILLNGAFVYHENNKQKSLPINTNNEINLADEFNQDAGDVFVNFRGTKKAIKKYHLENGLSKHGLADLKIKNLEAENVYSKTQTDIRYLRKDIANLLTNNLIISVRNNIRYLMASNGGHANGLHFYKEGTQEDSTKLLGTFGTLTSAGVMQKMYIGFGQDSWSSGAALEVFPNKDVNVVGILKQKGKPVALQEDIDTRIQRVIGSAPEALNTLKELSDALGNDHNFASTITNKLSAKVDKVSGKQLSTNDFTTAEKQKLASLSNYSHPAKHPADIITETSSKRFVTDVEKTKWNKYEQRISHNRDEIDAMSEIVLDTGNFRVNATKLLMNEIEKIYEKSGFYTISNFSDPNYPGLGSIVLIESRVYDVYGKQAILTLRSLIDRQIVYEGYALDDDVRASRLPIEKRLISPNNSFPTRRGEHRISRNTLQGLNNNSTVEIGRIDGSGVVTELHVPYFVLSAWGALIISVDGGDQENLIFMMDGYMYSVAHSQNDMRQDHITPAGLNNGQILTLFRPFKRSFVLSVRGASMPPGGNDGNAKIIYLY